MGLTHCLHHLRDFLILHWVGLTYLATFYDVRSLQRAAITKPVFDSSIERTILFWETFNNALAGDNKLAQLLTPKSIYVFRMVTK